MKSGLMIELFVLKTGLKIILACICRLVNDNKKYCL